MSLPWWAHLAPTRRVARGRRFTTRSVLAAVIASAILGGVLAYAVTGPHTVEVHEHDWGTTTRPAVDVVPAGCGPLMQVTSPSVRVGWVDAEGVLPYDTVPPVAGWMLPEPPAPGEVSPRPEAVVRAMWSGANIVWVAPDQSLAFEQAARDLVDANPHWGAVVYRWPASREDLGGAIGFATWGAAQVCNVPIAQVGEAVFAATTGAPGAGGGEPEPIVSPER